MRSIAILVAIAFASLSLAACAGNDNGKNGPAFPPYDLYGGKK